MHDEFDPYREWLGRTTSSRPLNYYQLLGLRDFEDDRRRIESAEMIEMAKVLRHESGPHADMARKLCAELEQAVATLSDPGLKAAYDAQLRGGQPLPSSTSSNYYQLLNLAESEENVGRIETAHMIEMSKVLRQGAGSERVAALDLALATLSDPTRKAAYDAQLRLGRTGALQPRRSEVEQPIEVPAARAVEAPAVQASPIYDTSADLKLHDEEEEEEVFDRSLPAELVETAVPLTPVGAAPPEPVDDDPLVPPAEKPNKPQKVIYDSYNPLPIEKPRRFSVQLPSLSLMPLVKAAGGIAALGLLVWAGSKLIDFGEPLGQLHGKITLDGQSVVGAEMRVESTTNPDHLFAGITGNDGVYQLSYRVFEGLPVGRYKITVSRQTLADGKPPQAAAEGEELTVDEAALITTTYVFEHDVVRGSNEIDLELNNGKKLELGKGG